MAYKRILLKLSGEQLAGSHQFGVDPKVARYLAKEIKKVTDTGCGVIIISGGGNMVRGAELAGKGIKRVTADQMGMLSGLMNAMALTDIFESEGLESRCVSNIYATQLAESYSYRLAEKHLQRGRVLIIAGGSGRPYVTHDTAAVMLGLELDCEMVYKSTKVDGVYDKDPAKFADAVKLDSITLQKAIENPAIKVMDKAALGLAAEQGMKITIFNLDTPGNFAKVVAGKDIGTLIS
ncbi:MAG: UMP kinase [bacterium]